MSSAESSPRSPPGPEGVSAPMVAGQAHEFSLPEALKLTWQLVHGKQFEEAEHVCQTILTAWPDQPDALNVLGVMRHSQGRNEDARQVFEYAVALHPQLPALHNNLGNVLARLDSVDEAIVAFQRAIELGGQSREAASGYSNLGRVLRRRGDLPAAEAALRQAIALHPEGVDAWFNLSTVLVKLGRTQESVLAHCKAVALYPMKLQARDNFIRALVTLGEVDEARRLYAEWLAEEPDNEIIRHHYAACGGLAVPERASDSYVQEVFDSFSNSFDEKLKHLDYRAPDLVAEALGRAVGPPPQRLVLADLGCGTGWCGPLVRPWASRLVGCDLSAGMLDKASAAGAYDELEQAELVAYLASHPQAFDAVISADTLCYFGDLSPVMAACQGALRPGGHFIYTVEALTAAESGPHVLRPNGRYGHAREHLESTADRAGLPVLAIEPVALRREAGAEVRGWLVTLARR